MYSIAEKFALDFEKFASILELKNFDLLGANTRLFHHNFALKIFTASPIGFAPFVTGPCFY